MKFFSILTLVVATSSLATTALAKKKECTMAADGTCVKEPQCGVYMAPSTLSGDTNMGIYTGIDLYQDDVVNFPEIAIPILFREWGDHRDGFDDGTLWDRYIWEGHIMEIESYTETNREDNRAVFVPGVGCTVNSVLDMNNIESTHGSTYDTAGLHRSRDPGSNAFAPYHSALTTVSVEHISPGAELFASYGDYWIPNIPNVQVTMDAPMDEAEDFVSDEYYKFIQQHSRGMSEDLKQGLWEFTKDFPLEAQSMSNLPRVPWKDVEAYLKAHPEKDEEEDDDDDDKYSVVRHFIRQKSQRSLEWLKEFGYCQDHLKPGISKIPQAGRGAFASRDLPAGTIVGYAPLVHMGLYGRDVLTVEYPDDRPSQYDLVINYSFGHKDSSILLTPYGGMVNYINHDSKAPNVKVQWPSKELVAHKPEWLWKSPEFLRDTIEKIGLSFEYVALRDIAEGEEVVMDYGPAWEEAWREYVKNWEPPADAHLYQHSTEFWEQEKRFRTAAELQQNPYPPNLVTLCYESFSSMVDEQGQSFYEWVHVLRRLHMRVYCDVLERFDATEADQNATYTVQMHLPTEDPNSFTSIVVHQVEQDGIFLYDRAFSQDWHLPNSFRHEIAIPEDVMPAAWLNGPAQPKHQRQF